MFVCVVVRACVVARESFLASRCDLLHSGQPTKDYRCVDDELSELPTRRRMIELMYSLFEIREVGWLESPGDGKVQYGLFAREDLYVNTTRFDNIILEYRGNCSYVSYGEDRPVGPYIVGWDVRGGGYRYIDGRRKALSRELTLALVNHSRQPNIICRYYRGRVVGILCKDVPKGEEILSNYGSDYTHWFGGTEQRCHRHKPTTRMNETQS